MTERAVSRPPPKDLLKRIAAAQAEVDKREAERTAAWDSPGNYHVAHNGWRQAVAELQRLERQLAAHPAHAQQAVAHE